MDIKALHIPGCYLFTPPYFEDERGGFYEAFHLKTVEEAVGQPLSFVQDNLSVSRKGTLRGLHFQAGEHAQAKYLRVLQGAVLDVVVDLRKDSPTYREHFAIQLNARERQALFIPRGMAHGFLALEEETHFLYKCDNYYQPESERGIYYKDAELNIDWGLPEEEIILSAKDKALPTLKNAGL